LDSSSATPQPPFSDCGDLLHFRLIGLKDLYRADICLEDGGGIKGRFHLFDDYSDSPTTTTTFEGRRDRKRIEVLFLSGKTLYPTSPDSVSSEDSSVVWHLDAEPPATMKLTF
jgi:hypothetical protein